MQFCFVVSFMCLAASLGRGFRPLLKCWIKTTLFGFSLPLWLHHAVFYTRGKWNITNCGNLYCQWFNCIVVCFVKIKTCYCILVVVASVTPIVFLGNRCFISNIVPRFQRRLFIFLWFTKLYCTFFSMSFNRRCHYSCLLPFFRNHPLLSYVVSIYLFIYYLTLFHKLHSTQFFSWTFLYYITFFGHHFVYLGVKPHHLSRPILFSETACDDRRKRRLL